jgi:LPXTG-site transpeptidase (sortase) family protein
MVKFFTKKPFSPCRPKRFSAGKKASDFLKGVIAGISSWHGENLILFQESAMYSLKSISRCLSVFLLLALTLLPAAPVRAAPGDTTRVSVASDGTEANGLSTGRTISADGRYVAFSSAASNLVSGDTNGFRDIFVHDRQTGATTRVSVASDGTQGNNSSHIPSISADGLYVAFESDASNLVSGDTNGTRDIFVHDRQTGVTTRVSVASSGTQANGGSYNAAISADGRYVAFESVASNLVSGDTNGARDVFVHDRQTGTTTRVSVASSGTQGNGNSHSPAISADGRYVAFHSFSNNLVSGDTNGAIDIFVRDRQTGATTRVSVASGGTQGNSNSEYSSFSADGRYVAFESNATNLVSGDTNGIRDIFVHDRQTGVTTRVSVASGGTQANNNSNTSSISSDGRYVAFHSYASNLVSGDTNGAIDVFVHDRQTGATIRASVASDGTQGNGNSQSPAISADGLYVVFLSFASNLVSGDTNGTWDIFVHEPDFTPPLVASLDLQASYVGAGPASFRVQFNKSVADPPGNTDPDDVTTPANYLLVEKGPNGAADTLSCLAGVSGDDVQQTVTSVAYNSITYESTATLTGALPVGNYRLFVCGTTSIVSLAGVPLNNGSDYTFDFTVSRAAAALPATGFPMGRVTHLNIQPEEKAYVTYGELTLEIPSLGIAASIVGVPQTSDGWDVSWLGKSAGWLEGSAFPTWQGNTVLTAHVWNADNTPGIFANIKSLKYGDRFSIHAFGQEYIYEVRENTWVWGSSVSKVFKHEEYDWVTLLTCEGYNPLTGRYFFRRMVRAVLVAVK